MPGDLVEFPFSAGLDEGTDPRRTPKFRAVQNYVWTKRGRLEKRSGYTTLPTLTYPLASGVVIAVTLTAGGSGYTGTGFLFTFTGGGGVGGGGIAVVVAGAVTSLIFLSGGVAYTSPPTLDFSAGPGGTGAAGTSTVATVGGNSLTGSQTIAVSPEGALQTTDGQFVYGFTSGFWHSLGTLRNVGVSVTNTGLLAETTIGTTPYSGTENPVNWLMCQCADFTFWYWDNSYVFQTEAGATVSKADDQPGYGPTAIATDGARFIWKFNIGFGANAVTWDLFDLNLTGAPPVIPGGLFPAHTYLPGSGEIPIPAWFDAVWNPTSSTLVTAYVDTVNPFDVTVSTWSWNSTTYHWTNVSTTLYAIVPHAFTFKALSVTVGAGSGLPYVAYAFVDTTTNHSMVKAAQLGSSAVLVYDQAQTTTADVFNVTVTERSVNGAMLVAFTAKDIIPGSAFATNVLYAYEVDDGGVVTANTRTVGQALASRAFSQGGRPYALTYTLPAQSYYVHDLTGQSTPASATANPALPIALINPRIAFQEVSLTAVPIQSPWGLPTPTLSSANVWRMPITTAPEPGQSALLNEQILTLDFNALLTRPAPEWQGMIYPASIPSIVGAGSVREAQFMAPPTIVDVVLTGHFGGSGGLEAGNYLYVATYARVLDDGTIMESPPSQPFTITATLHDTADVYVTQYALAPQPLSEVGVFDIRILLYRSQVNQGQALYRTQNDPFTRAGTNTNNVAFNALPYNDTATDPAIARFPQLYTGGGVFENVSPPACTIAARVRDRVYLAGTPDGFSVYYSDPVKGLGTANFHDEQVIISEDDGPVTGISELDANVLLFKAEAVYIVYGTEGSNTGAGSTLSTPVALPTGGVGCISHDSIVYTNQGVMFQSQRGIELIDRKTNITFIGESVKDKTAGKTVVAALLVPEQYQVRFYMSDWSTMVLSTLNGEWTTFDYAGKPTAAISGVTIANGIIYWCGSAHVMQETVGTYSDNGSIIQALWQSGWFSLGQIEGYKRYRALQLLGEWFAETNISAFILTDYLAAPVQTSIWTAADIAAIPEFDSYRVQLEITPVLQKGESVSITLLDSGPTDGTFTKGIGWESITFEVTAKPGRYRKISNEASR